MGCLTRRLLCSTLVIFLGSNLLACGGSSSGPQVTGVSNASPLSVTATTPTNGATNVSTSSALTATFSEPIDPATVTATTFTLEDGASGPVTGNITTTGATVTFALPPGTPLNFGTAYTATLNTGVKDLAGNAIATPYTWSFTTNPVSNPTPPTITTASLPIGTVTQSYPATTLQATGGTAPLTWDPVVQPALPNGLSWNASSHTISGTPLSGSQGTTSHTFMVKDSINQTGTRTLSLTINLPAPPNITTTSTSLLPNGTVGTPYSRTLTASGGTGALTWSISSGTLPTGVTLNQVTGVISGTPSAASTLTFTPHVTDSISQTDTTPPSLSITITAPVPGTSYSTSFDLTENPISEGGQWSNHGTFWTTVQTANGLAYGTNGVANSYDDSYAYLSSFPADQQGEAVIYVSPTLAGDPHEAEILLRFADSATIARGYECLFNYAGGVQIMRWEGPFGSFTEIGGGSLGRRLVTGDVVTASIVGNVIKTYINGTLIAQASDSTWTTGQPGIGFFRRTQGASSDLAFSSYTATAK